MVCSLTAWAQSNVTDTDMQRLPPAEQNELAGLQAEVVKLHQANKLAEALTVAEKLRQRSETLLGADAPQTIGGRAVKISGILNYNFIPQ